MEIAAIPDLDASVTAHTLPDDVSSAARHVEQVRDWAQGGSAPADWTGDTAVTAEHRMTAFAENTEGVVVRLEAAAVALRDYVDEVVRLRGERALLVDRRDALVGRVAEYAVAVAQAAIPTTGPPAIPAWELQWMRSTLETDITTFNTDVSTWSTAKSDNEQMLRSALFQSRPDSADERVGLASSYIAPSEARELMLALSLEPHNPELLAQLEALIAQNGDDATAWQATYDALGPDMTVEMFAMFDAQYDDTSPDVDQETLDRAEGMREGLALATSRWTDAENAAFAESMIDRAAEHPEYYAAAVAYAFSRPPEGGTPLDGEFALAAADAVYEIETGDPPVRLRSGVHHGSSLYYAAIGADVNRPGFTFEVDVAGAVLGSLAFSPEHALEHLEHHGATEHWLQRDWGHDGYEGVTRVWDAALSAPGGVVYPPAADGPAYDPLVAANQARLMSEFFEHFADPPPMTPLVLTDDAMTSLGNISGRASTFASWVATEQTGTTDDHVFLGLPEYEGAYLPTFSDEDLARVMGLGIEHPSFTESYGEVTGRYTAEVLQGMEDGRLDGMDGMKSVVTLTALTDGLNERIGIEAGAGQDAFADGVGLVVDVASYIPGGVGVAFEVGGWGMTGAEYLGIIGDAEGQARAASLEALIDHLSSVDDMAGAGYTADEVEDLRRFYSEQYQSLIILPG